MYRGLRTREAEMPSASSWTVGLFVFAISSGCASEARCSDGNPQPSSLEECYLQVAMHKATADMAFLAREMCDRVFAPPARSIVVLDRRSGRCVEQWFDNHERHETAEKYCSLERSGKRRWSYACQYKDRRHAGYTVVELLETDAGFQRQGAVVGDDPGPLFATLAQCLKHRAEAATKR